MIRNFFVFIFVLWIAPKLVAAPFRITIYAFPQNLSTQKQTSTISYLFNNLFRNLFIYGVDHSLQTDLAEKCAREKKGLILRCTLRKNLRWSNGEPLIAKDFINTYRQILDPKSKSARPDFLFPVKNAIAIAQGTKAVDSLGVFSSSPRELIFELEVPDDEFEYNLSTYYLSPTKGSYDFELGHSFMTNGPYKVKTWEIGKSISLVNDENYFNPTHRPDIEFINVFEDAAALELYEQKKIDFVRRIPTLLRKTYEARKDYHSVLALRFDYLGFGPELKDSEEARHALSESLDFGAWQKLLASAGRPGCAGFPDSWQKPVRKCLEQVKRPPLKIKKDWRYEYSLQGGDDLKRTAEWVQKQWKKKLDLNFKIEGIEHKVYLAKLKTKAATVFSKGIAADRATCSGVFEHLTSEHADNFSGLHDPGFDALVLQMRRASGTQKKAKLCRQALDKLLDPAWLIPIGPYNLNVLVNPQFTGWKLNELNQLDLADLHQL